MSALAMHHSVSVLIPVLVLVFSFESTIVANAFQRTVPLRAGVTAGNEFIRRSTGILAPAGVGTSIHGNGGLLMTTNDVNVPKLVQVFKSSNEISAGLCREFVDKAKREISNKGTFFAAIPGGSVLKLLSGLKSYKNKVNWSRVHIFYVNHKCVANDDPTATHYKAKSQFLDELGIEHVYSVGMDDEGLVKGHDTDAHQYSSHLDVHLPKINGLPQFDYMVLGLGKDGGVAALHPGKQDVLNDKDWVLTVDEKFPPSISLSMPVINNAKHIRVVLMGADKAEALRTGVYKSKAPVDFPACAISAKGDTRWMVDEASSKLL